MPTIARVLGEGVPACFREFPVLRTERLVLRRIGTRDVPALFALFSDEEVARFWSSIPMEVHEEADELVEKIERAYREGRGIEWGVTLRGDDRVIAKVAFHRWLPDHLRAELGYAVARPHWRRGIASEAVAAVLDYGFGPMGLHSVEAHTDPANEGSIATLTRLGFRREGLQRENYRVAGRFVDTLMFGLLDREWAARRAG